MAKQLAKGFRRKKNGLEYRFMLDGQRYSVFGASEKDCRQKRDELRDRIAAGLLPDRKSLTLHQYYEEWEKRREALVRPTTLYTDKRRFKRIDKALGHKKVIDIERRDVYKLQSDLREDLSTKGVNDAISLLRTILESAVTDRIIPYNPTAGVKPLPKTEEEAGKDTHRFLTTEELQTFFEYGKDSIYIHLFRFLLYTGVRCGEAGALTWADIDEVNGWIHITKTVTRVDDKTFTIGPPKTMDSRRDILLTDEIKAVLDKQRALRVALHGIKAASPDSQVFTTMTGCLINQSNMCPTIRNICDKAAAAGRPIKRFTPHAFRHTFVSRELADGVQPVVIARQVGHSNTITLQRFYAHEDPEQLREAFKQVSANMADIVKIS